MAENFVQKGNLTYSGKEAQEIFVKQIFESDLKAMGIRLMPGVKGKQKLVSGDVDDLYQAYSCPFTPNGAASLAESYIEPDKIKINLEECFDEFWDTYLVEQTEITLNGGIPQDFFDWFFNNVLQKEEKKEYEDMFWNGDKSGSGVTGLTNGIVTIAKSTGAVQVSKQSLNASNILGQIGAVVASVNDLDNATEDYKIFVNYKDYRHLMTALGNNSPLTTAVFANFSKEGNKVYAYGYEVVPCRIAKDTILASHPKNLVLGYDAEDAEIGYKIVDMRETTLDNAFRVANITNIAVGVVYPTTIVLTY